MSDSTPMDDAPPTPAVSDEVSADAAAASGQLDGDAAPAADDAPPAAPDDAESPAAGEAADTGEDARG